MKSFRSLFLLLMLCIILSPLMAGPGSDRNTDGVTTFQMFLVNLGGTPRGLPEVQEAVNRIIEPQGIRVNLNILDAASFTSQVPVRMASGDPIDLMHPQGGGTSFVNLLATNALMDLTDLLPRHGPRLLPTIDEYIPGVIAGTTINGRIMAVPQLKNKVSNYYLMVRGDLLARHNLGSLDSLNSLADIERLLTAFRAAEPNIPAIIPAAGQSGRMGTLIGAGYDIYDFNNQVEYIIVDSIGHVDPRDPHTVINIYRSPHYRRMLETVHRWYQNGLVLRDAAVNQEMAEELVRAGRGFAWFGRSEIGLEATKSGQTGYPIVARQINNTIIETTTVRRFAYVVPTIARAPEAAIKFLELWFTDERLSSLLAWGVEGRDWIRLPDGTADYPPGVTAQTVAYRSVDFFTGNQFITPPWTGNPPDLRQQSVAQHRTTPLSPIFGFSFDPSSVRTEIAAITSVVDQYVHSLASGTIDPAVNLPIFLDALDRAGAERIIAEQQRQLDAWWAQQRR